MFACGSAVATAIPKVHHLLPHLNLDWFTFLLVVVVLAVVLALLLIYLSVFISFYS